MDMSTPVHSVTTPLQLQQVHRRPLVATIVLNAKSRPTVTVEDVNVHHARLGNHIPQNSYKIIQRELQIFLLGSYALVM